MSVLRTAVVMSVLVVGLVAGSILIDGKASGSSGQSKRNGMVYVSWSEADYSSALSDLSLAALAGMGVSSVELLVTWYQDNLNSTTIQPSASSPSIPSLLHAIATLQSLNIDVVLKPHVDCLCGDWRGQIGTQFTNEAQWESWFSSYTQFIVSFAQIAEQNNQPLFNIGTELAGTSMRRADWEAVIAAIRNVYSGELTYGSNWGSETVQVQFWSALDYIGVDAYYPLANQTDPTFDQIVEAWVPWKTILAGLSDAWNKSVIFTEIGYRSYPLAAEQPWVFQGNGAPDMAAQYNLYLAMMQTVYVEPWFAGVYWWAWETSPFNGGPCDDGYNPCRKPAAALLASLYTSSMDAMQSPSVSYHVPMRPRRETETNVIYQNGQFGAGWQSWSYSGVFESMSTTSVYPQHAYSFEASQVTPGCAGAVSFWNANATVWPNSQISFNILSLNASTQLDVFLCTCNDCSTCATGSISLAQFLPASDDCGLPTNSAWTNSTVVIPLTFFSYPPVDFNRVTICNANTDGTLAAFFLDNVVLLA